MDPLSIAASVAGLCTLAESIVHRTRAYVRCVRGSEKEIAKLIRATAQLYGILEQIRLLEDGFDNDNGREKGMVIGGVGMVRGVHLVKGEELHECEKTLRKLDAVLRKSDPGTVTGFVNVARKKLEWPFNSKEVAEILQDIENHKSMLNLALNANEMAAILSCLDTSTHISQIVSQEQLANEDFRTSQRKSAFSRRRQKILDFMTTLDPRIDQTMYVQMKQDMTGLWFTEGDEFKAWMSKRNATLWLSGIPGAGKTILFSSVVDKLQRVMDANSVMAYFYCDYRNPIKQDATTIIRSLIRQFAERNDLCFDKLEEFYEVHSSDDKISLPTQKDLLILLMDMSEDVEDALILIDALDECLTERVTVIKLLRDLNIQSEKIKTLFASRNEVDISAQLQGYTTVSMAENTSDIARYVESELKVKDWAKDLSQTEKEAIKDSLIEPAGGMFRLVACQLDALAKCKTTASRRKVLRTLPRDLSETYYRILKQIDSTDIADNRLIVQRVLKWVTWAATGLSLYELQEAVAINAGDEELDPDVITTESDILDLCSSLVRCNPSGIIELAHATVKEFLTTIPSKSEYYFYHVDEASDMTALATTCLTYLCLDNFGEEKDWDSASIISGRTSISFKTSVTSSEESGMPDRVLQYHFLDHAAENWDYYAGKVTENWPQVLALEKILFAPTKAPQFLNWARRRLESTRHRRNRDGGLLAESTTLQWAALLGLPAICQWLIDQGSDVNRATVVLGSSLACAVLGESVFHQCISNGSEPGSDDGSSDYDEGYNVKESRAWHSENRYKTIAALLSWGAVMDGMPLEETRSLMELALMIGEPSHVKLLLSHGAVLDTDCLAYLENQCSDGPRKAEMQEILSSVTKSNYASIDAQKATKLLLQFETSSVQAAKLLADTLGDLTMGEGTDVQDKNVALRKVSEYGQYELVAQLLDHPDIATDHVDKYGSTALHEAAQSGHLKVVQLLVEKNFKINARDKDGDTPAMRAASCNHLEVVQYLQQHGAVLADQVNTEGETIALLAAKSDCHRIVRYIAETDPRLVSSATTSSNGMTVLMVAAEKGSVKSTQYILDKFPTDEVTAKSKDGRSALHFAAASGNKKVAEMILRNHPDVNIKSGDGCIALHYAVDDCLNPGLVNALLIAGADGTIKNNMGDLPAHYAATQGGWDNFSVLKKLVEAAGDKCEWLNEESGSCRTVLQIVTSHSNFTDYSLKMIDLFCGWSGLALEPPSLGIVGGIPLLNLVGELSKRTVYKPLPGLPEPPTDAWRLFEAIKLLVRRGASIECTDPRGNTALHILCLGNLNLAVCDAVDFLLQNSAPTTSINKDGSSVMDALFSRLTKGPVSPDMQVYTQRILSHLIDHSSDDQLKNYRLDGMQLLNLCIQVGNSSIIRKLLGRGAEVDIPDKIPSRNPGLSPARAICIYKTSDGVADEILDKCSDLNCLDDAGITMLVLACRFGKIDVARSLIAKGADRPTAVQGARAMADAAYNGHTEIVQFLIELGVDINSTYGDRRMTPLMHAVERGNLATIKLLLEKKADVSIKAAKQWTLAHYLASREDPTFLEEMLLQNLIWDESAKVVGQHGNLVGGVTPLHVAAERGFTGMITFLLGKKLIADVNATNDLMTTPLHVAVRVGNCYTVKTLLEAGADVNAQDVEGYTPVHIAASHSRVSRFPLVILQDLLGTGKYDHFLVTQEAQTPLHVAARQGTINLVTLLLETPENVNAKDNKWLTPLHYAIVRGNSEIIEVLEAAGAKHFAPSSRTSSIDGDTSTEKQTVEPPPVFGANSLLLAAIRQRDLGLCKRAFEEGADLSFKFSECKKGKCTPLLFAIDGHKNTGNGFFNHTPAIAEFIADQDVDINAKSCMSDMLPMHLAAARGQDSVVRKLLVRGAKTKIRTLEALHLAVMHGSIVTIKVLLEHEESIEGGSKQSLLNSQVSSADALAFREYPDFVLRKLLEEPYCGSAMHIAAYMGHDGILELLIKEGAEVDSLNEFNHTPLMHAIWTDKQKSIQVLLDAGASISHRDDFGRTPAYFALGNKNTMALTALQKKGADFSEGEYPNTWTIETYLNQALFQESWSIVDFLLKLGHDPNRHSGPYAHTPLQVALQIVNTVKLEAFVAEHAPEYDENFERYGTLLAAACSQSNPALVRMLLEKAKGNGRDMVEYVNAGCYVYATPLYSAAFRGNMELLLMLIEEGADVRSKEGGWLGTPLDAACAMERVDVVRVLWERGACLRKSKMEGPWMAEGCKGSVKMEAIRGILNGRDPYTPGPEMESRAGIIMAGRPLKDEIGGKLVSRQTF